jgi:hypothetical protein
MAVSTHSTSATRQRARFIGLLAGLLAGILNAVLARVAMRVIALALFGRGSFSVAGTAVIFLFGLLVGPLFGLLYRSVFYPLHVPALGKGLLFGLTLLVVLQVPGLYLVPEFMAELMAAGPLGFGAFAAMNFAFVLTLAPLTAWLEQRWPHDESRAAIEKRLTAGFGLLALGGLALLVVEMGGRLLGLI